ncbi:MAG TPA: HAMP domain-containing histidine kinase [archaeon]|nr:HAMP domain-containing histidine kinase [archaeon]
MSKTELKDVNYVKLEFMDNGIGVQDSKKEGIFLEGYKELKGGKGMGIGLSLITKIIKLYNGKIWVEDRTKGDY